MKALDAMVAEMEADEREAGAHSPNDTPESAENVSAETSAAGFGVSVSAETSYGRAPRQMFQRKHL